MDPIDRKHGNSPEAGMNLSVVVPAYRSERWVERTIRSAIAEGVAERNVIVVEDGVLDGTGEVVQATGARLFSLQQNGGAPHARNLGLAQVETEYVMFLDADDYVENGLLTGLVEALERERADVAIGPWVYDGEGRERGMLRQPPALDNGERIFHWVMHAFFPPCCIAWRTDAIRSIGAWDERLRKDQDGELMIRALIRGLKVAISSQGNGVYWQHNSPHRVTKAQIKDVMYAADVVFEQIEGWVRSRLASGAGEDQRFALGRFCCKTAWVAYAYGDSASGARWSAKAREFGFHNRGYNARSALLASFLGTRIASRVKASTSSVYRRIAQR